MTWTIMILDLPFTTPMLSETSKRKKMRFWSIGLFFCPSIAFLPNPDSDSDQHFVSRTSKRLFWVVFRALASGRTTSRLRRGILFEFYSLAGNCKMILAMILLMWCSSCCHCFGNTRVTHVFFKKPPDVLERNLYRFRFTWVCLKVVICMDFLPKWASISGDNDNDDN